LTDFILSRQAMNCTVSTLQFYRFTVGVFLAWIESQRATDPQQVTARHVMQYLAQLINAGRKDTTIHANARAILTLVRYWHAEGYVSAEIKFDMLKLSKKRLPVLTAEQWQCERQSHNFIYG
jgi:site-specific recombinase XerD